MGELADLGVDNGFWASNAEYVVTWPDGTVTTADNGDGSPFLGATWDVPEDTLFNGQQICVTVEDIYDCYSLEACGLVFIGDDPVNDPQPTTIETICVESDLVIFDLNANINGPITSIFRGFWRPTAWSLIEQPTVYPRGVGHQRRRHPCRILPAF